MNKLSALAQEIEKIAYELDVFGVQKEAAQPRLYEYEYEGMKFYMEEKKPQGVRLPAGKALFTKKFYPVSGALAKDLKEDSDE